MKKSLICLVHLVINSQKVCFQVTPENAKTLSWVMKTVWQRIKFILHFFSVITNILSML